MFGGTLNLAQSINVVLQVVKCGGFSGNNAEYVTRLADFVRHHIPHDDDHELFDLDAQVRRLLTSDVNASRSSSAQDWSSTPASSSSVAFDHYEVTDRQISTHRHSHHVAVTVIAG